MFLFLVRLRRTILPLDREGAENQAHAKDQASAAGEVGEDQNTVSRIYGFV
jgi:hypothetical protein